MLDIWVVVLQYVSLDIFIIVLQGAWYLDCSVTECLISRMTCSFVKDIIFLKNRYLGYSITVCYM